MFGFFRNPFRKRAADPTMDESLWSAPFFMAQTASGIQVSQVTALSSSAVYACVAILSEDVAKIRPILFKRRPDGGRDIVADHWLAKLLRRPNPWQTGFEFRQFLMVQLCLRSNAYAVIIRNAGGRPIRLVPINSDRVAIWEAPSGDLFYRVTPLGLHEMAQLRSEPFLIPAEDVLHLRALSIAGLLGSALMVLGKEAIGLALAYEQQAARWMSNGSKPSGALSTEQKLTQEAAKRMAQDWRDIHTGLQNAGKVAVLEQGLKFQPFAFDAIQMDFIKSRQYQLEDLARMLRVPLHMIGSTASGGGKGAGGAVEQQAAEYINLTVTTHTTRIGEKFDAVFEISEQGLELDWDYSILTRADQATRYTAYSKAIAGGYLTPNEARVDDGRNPLDGGDHLWQPVNVAWAGSQASGGLPDGGGRPPGAPNNPEGSANA